MSDGKALIVEAGYTRGALAATRALSRAGWTVGVATPTRAGLAGTSRHATHRHPLIPPERDLDGFVRAVNSAVAGKGYQIVFGGGDAEVIALSSRRTEIDAIVPYAPHGAVIRALDKLQLAAAGRNAGLAVPETVEATPERLRQWPAPLFVKASLHAPLSGHEGPGRFAARPVADRDTALRRMADIRSAGGVPVLQEQIAGRLLAYVVVADHESRVVSRVQQISDRIWPPGAGVSARARTVPVDERVAGRVAALLRELSWFGLAQLQFVVPDDGEPRLIDFNGRFYGSLALAIGAGPNLPAIWAALATGTSILPPELSASAVPGVRYQWLEGDLRRALVERRGGLAADLAGSLRYARGRCTAFGARVTRGRRSAIWPLFPGASADGHGTGGGWSLTASPQREPASPGSGPQARLRQTCSATSAQISFRDRSPSSLRTPSRPRHSP